jgi:hypothetical protein
MDWILEHFQIVVLAFIAVVWVLKSIFGANKPPAEEQHNRPSTPSAADPAEAERTRQIQEEIRRRILARQRGETLAPAPAPVAPPPPAPVVVHDGFEREEPEVFEPEYQEEGPRAPMPSAAAHRQADTAQAAILEQQRMLAEQLHALRAARAAGASVTPLPALTLPRDASAAIASHRESCRLDLMRDLRHPKSLQRAILLREILGPPLALQRGPARSRR